VGRTLGTAAVAAVVGLIAAGCSDSERSGSPKERIPQATPAQLEAAGVADLPLARASSRVDLEMPSFSHPTRIENPLFPISRLRSAILSGHVEGERFKSETTLLPQTRIVEWPEGRPVETRVSQYVAYVGGRLEEVALDYYAQADDGSVWYFGEDVFNYRDGVIADTEGTWLAGREGPAAMIMPADPRVGDAYRSENVPGLVFEEVTIGAVGRTVRGPRGPVTGAIIAEELHQDGEREDKTFAPGYGEFFTGGGGSVEAMALAVPTDALNGPVPRELEAITAGADAVFAAARRQRWRAASAAARKVDKAWRLSRTADVPPRLRDELERAVAELNRAVAARASRRSAAAAFDVSSAALDLRLRYRPPAEIDRARFELWARRLLVDAKANNLEDARGDLATLEWVRDRFAHTLDSVDRTRIDAVLGLLRTKLAEEDLRGAAAEAARLRAVLGR
jgi:hypothetical protein